MYIYIDRYRCFYLYFQLENHPFEKPLPGNFGHPCLRVDAKRAKNALSFVPIVTQQKSHLNIGNDTAVTLTPLKGAAATSPTNFIDIQKGPCSVCTDPICFV